MTRRPSIVVFTGPTIGIGEAASVLDAVYLQPASQGDIILAAHAYRPDLMILIDGTFQGCPAVRHKEILWAIAQGITVLGASSMGAIRAAELAGFGMVGVGVIYRWYRRWLLAPDDAVAIQSGPHDTGYINLTDSLINLRASFSHLARMGLVSRRERDTLRAVATKTHFRERRFREVLSRCGIPDERIEQCARHRIDLKHADALAALRFGRSFEPPRTKRMSAKFTATRSFIRDLHEGGVDAKYLHTYHET